MSSAAWISTVINIDMKKHSRSIMLLIAIAGGVFTVVAYRQGFYNDSGLKNKVEELQKRISNSGQTKIIETKENDSALVGVEKMSIDENSDSDCKNREELKKFDKPVSVEWEATFDGCLGSCAGAYFSRIDTRVKYSRFVTYASDTIPDELRKNDGSILKIYGRWIGIGDDYTETSFGNQCVPVIEIDQINLIEPGEDGSTKKKNRNSEVEVAPSEEIQYGGEVLQVGGIGSMIYQEVAYNIGGDTHGFFASGEDNDWINVTFNSARYLMNVWCKEGYEMSRCIVNGKDKGVVDGVCLGMLEDRVNNIINIVCVNKENKQR